MEKDDYIKALEADIAQLKESRNAVYRERNLLVTALAHAINTVPTWGRAWVAEHRHKDDEDWDPEWNTIVYIESFGFQFSWHFHIDEVKMLEALPRGENTWDGHTTWEKYQRLREWWARL